MYSTARTAATPRIYPRAAVCASLVNPCSGADDMAVWTARLWTRWQGWLEQGPPASYPDGPGASEAAPEVGTAAGAAVSSPRSLRSERLHHAGASEAASETEAESPTRAASHLSTGSATAAATAPARRHGHRTPTIALRPLMAALAPRMRADGLLHAQRSSDTGSGSAAVEGGAGDGWLDLQFEPAALPVALQRRYAAAETTGAVPGASSAAQALLQSAIADGGSVDVQMGLYLSRLLRTLLHTPSAQQAADAPATLAAAVAWPPAADAAAAPALTGPALAREVLRALLLSSRGGSSSLSDSAAQRWMRGAVQRLSRASGHGVASDEQASHGSGASGRQPSHAGRAEKDPAALAVALVLELLDSWEERMAAAALAVPPAPDDAAAATVGGAVDGYALGSTKERVYHAAAPALAAPVAVVASASPLEYFGSAIAVGDFNGDGADDVAMCGYGYSYASPATANLWLAQAGGFYVRYGAGNATSLTPTTALVAGHAARSETAEEDTLPHAGGSNREQQPAGAAVPLGDAPVAPVPADTALRGDRVFSRLGWAACSLDFNLGESFGAGHACLQHSVALGVDPALALPSTLLWIHNCATALPSCLTVADGVDDLAVSAPTQGWPSNWDPASTGPQGPWQANFYYQGAVHVYFGVRGAGLPSGNGSDAQPDVMIVTGTNETHMGSTLR